jgi:hypothetical protein
VAGRPHRRRPSGRLDGLQVVPAAPRHLRHSARVALGVQVQTAQRISQLDEFVDERLAHLSGAALVADLVAVRDSIVRDEVDADAAVLRS